MHKDSNNQLQHVGVKKDFLINHPKSERETKNVPKTGRKYIDRLLDKNVGNDWNRVYSKICRKYPKKISENIIVHEYINKIVDHGDPVQIGCNFYIDPENNKLRKKEEVNEENFIAAA